MSGEFGIYELRPITLQKAELLGRVFSGCIRLGDRFVQANNLEFVSPDIKPVRNPVGGINLKVLRLLTYGRDVNLLEEGLTGAIFVEGRGIELLSPDISIVTERQDFGDL